MDRSAAPAASQKVLLRLFDLIDLEGDNYLDLNELHSAFECVGVAVDWDELEAWVRISSDKIHNNGYLVSIYGRA